MRKFGTMLVAGIVYKYELWPTCTMTNPHFKSHSLMAFDDKQSGAAATVFLTLYFLYCLVSGYVVLKKGWKTTYTILFFFGVIRCGAQVCGVALAIVGFDHWQWLIGYLVLGAEGYFMLNLAAFFFICKAQKAEVGSSWLLQSRPQWFPVSKWWLGLFDSYASFYHYMLIPANVLVINGGCLLTGLDADEYATNKGRITASKAMRTAGQAMFLLLTIICGVTASYVFKVERVRRYTNVSVLLAAPFLIVRGIFGVLSIYISDMNYFQMSNYASGTFSLNLVIYEYVLSTTMEFIGSGFLILNYFLDDDNKHFSKMQDCENQLLYSKE